MDVFDFFIFISASLAINAVPGADVIYAVSTFKHSGMNAAKSCIAGLFLGYLFHVLITYIGIAKIISSNEMVFNAIKYLGSAYLFYLGVRMIYEVYFANKSETGDISSNTNSSVSANSSYVFKGFLISALNPKVSLFFLSFIPQFINSDNADSFLTLILGFVFCLGATFFNFFYCYLSKIKLEVNVKVLKYVPGVMLTLLGVYTAV